MKKKLKKIQKHSKPLKVTKSLTTQTDPECNNNMQNFLLNTQTIPRSTNETSKSFNCFVCNEVFNEKSYLQMHAENKHEIELYSDTLLDFKETDTFIRFFRSIRMGNEYIAKRIHLYPEHWNHIEIEGRIKFRMLAKEKIRNLQQTH